MVRILHVLASFPVLPPAVNRRIATTKHTDELLQLHLINTVGRRPPHTGGLGSIPDIPKGDDHCRVLRVAGLPHAYPHVLANLEASQLAYFFSPLPRLELQWFRAVALGTGRIAGLVVCHYTLLCVIF